MQESLVVVQRKQGIHLQPAAKLVDLIKSYPQTKVSLIKDGKVLEADSVLNILSLNLAHKTELTLRVQGEQRQKCLDALKAFFAEVDP